MGEDARKDVAATSTEAVTEAAISTHLRGEVLADIFRSRLLLESTQKLAEALKALGREVSR